MLLTLRDAGVIMQMHSIPSTRYLQLILKVTVRFNKFQISLFYVYCQNLRDDQTSSIYKKSTMLFFYGLAKNFNVLILGPIISKYNVASVLFLLQDLQRSIFIF